MKDSDLGEPDSVLIDTTNEFLLGSNGNNIAPQFLPRLRTRQQAYRFAAWCQTMGESLPDEPGGHTFEQIRKAIRNT